MQSVSLQFGMIRKSDLKPGFAFKHNNDPDGPVYVVKSVSGKEKTFPPIPTPKTFSEILAYSDFPGMLASSLTPSSLMAPFTAEVFSKGDDGAYHLRTHLPDELDPELLPESITPVDFDLNGENPNYDPVQIRRDEDGRRLLIENA